MCGDGDGLHFVSFNTYVGEGLERSRQLLIGEGEGEYFSKNPENL